MKCRRRSSLRNKYVWGQWIKKGGCAPLCVERAKRRDETKPIFVVGSPNRCINNTLHNLSGAQWDPMVMLNILFSNR